MLTDRFSNNTSDAYVVLGKVVIFHSDMFC